MLLPLEISNIYFMLVTIVTILTSMYKLYTVIVKLIESKVDKYLRTIADIQREEVEILRLVFASTNMKDKKLYEQIDYDLKQIEKRLTDLTDSANRH